MYEPLVIQKVPCIFKEHFMIKNCTFILILVRIITEVNINTGVFLFETFSL